MACRYVEMRGKDGKVHSITLDASSAFDAAYKAAQEWSRLWWHDPNAVMTVQRGEQRWTVSQDKMREWSTAKVSRPY